MKKLLVAALLCAAVPLSAQVRNFDDLGIGNEGTAIANGTYGFNWTDFYHAEGCYHVGVTDYTQSGYCFANSSKPDVAFNGFGHAATISSSSAFTLGSAFLTAAWDNNLNLEVTGFLAGTQLFDRNITLSQNSGSIYTFNWSGIDQIVFTSSGGTDANSTDGGSGVQFVLDDIDLTPGAAAVTPEPATMSLVAFGLVGLAGAARRRRRA